MMHTAYKPGWISSSAIACGLALAVLVLAARPAVAQTATFAIRAGQPQPADNSHAERCLAAIDLAMLAAESGIMDVSVEAMHRATVKGPPVAGLELGGLLGSKPAPSGSRNQQPNTAASAQAKLAARLLDLHEVWKKKQADPTRAYEAFKSLVFPAGRPSEAFPYASRPLERSQINYSRTQYDAEEPKPEPCAAMALVEWAHLAGKEEDLKKVATERRKLPGAITASLLVEMLLAQQESHGPDEASALCDALAEQPKLLVSGPDAVLLFGHVWKMLDRLPADSPQRQKVLEAVRQAMEADPNWATNEWLIYYVSKALRDAVDTGNKEQFQQYAEIASSRYNSLRSNNADYVASQEAAMYGWAARRAFAAGHLRLAADCLRLQHQLPVSQTYLQSQSDAILDPLQPVVQALLTLQRDERYDILKSLAWKLPNLGMTRVARLSSNERLPRVFSATDTDIPWRAIAGETARGASLLEWTMRDAIALGRQSDIEDEIKRLEVAGSDDVLIARTVYRLAQNKPIEIATLLKPTADGGKQLMPTLGESGPVVPLDLEIASQAIAQPEHRAAGIAFVDRLYDLATSQHQDIYVTLTRALKLQLRETPFEVTQERLAHWIVADDIKEADYSLGNPAESLWAGREGQTWTHELGPNFSTLMLRYPLAGDYSISFRVSGSEYAEGAASLCGRMIELLNARNRLQVWGVGHRNVSTFSTDVLRNEDYHRVRLDRKGDTLTIHVNDRFDRQLDVPQEDFPFFGLASYHYRQSEFDELTISGDVTIPRHVEMLTPGLVGWSARFKGEQLPALAIAPDATLPDEEDQKLDWRIKDGVLESMKREPEKTSDATPVNPKYERPRRESVLQYLRPLAAGEEISLEFFHEPGKFTLAPALGRIAILLGGEKIGLHWITSDPAGVTTGVDDGNRVEDTAAEQPESVVLRPGDWNKLSLRLDGEVAVLSINEQTVYRRPWESEAGRLFGLFRNPQENEVRVRNIRLRGPWPEKLPADLFELQAGSEVTSVVE